MHFASYTIAIPYDSLAENLVNTLDASLAEPEHLRRLEDLGRFMRHHGLEPAPMTAQDLIMARSLRLGTRRVFESRDAQQAMRRTNALLRHQRYVAKLAMQDDAADIHWRIAVDGPAIARLEAAVALNLAALLQTVGFDRCRICEATPCRDVFIDLSKKGGRIFCGPRCASRINVARFRSRRNA
jgi:predicted RNA-binding Zn ribbon-like protein